MTLLPCIHSLMQIELAITIGNMIHVMKKCMPKMHEFFW